MPPIRVHTIEVCQERIDFAQCSAALDGACRRIDTPMRNIDKLTGTSKTRYTRSDNCAHPHTGPNTNAARCPENRSGSTGSPNGGGIRTKSGPLPGVIPQARWSSKGTPPLCLRGNSHDRTGRSGPVSCRYRWVGTVTGAPEADEPSAPPPTALSCAATFASAAWMASG